MVTEVGNPNREQVNMSTISKEAFIEAMREAVRQRGEDFVYPEAWRDDGACRYYIEDTPGVIEGACIIGKAIEIATGTPYTGYNGPADQVLLEEYGLDDRDVADAAFVAQRVQDTRSTWGDALAKFEEYVSASLTEQNRLRAEARDW